MVSCGRPGATGMAWDGFSNSNHQAEADLLGTMNDFMGYLTPLADRFRTTRRHLR